MEVLYIKVIHLIGAFCLFAGFGGLFGVGENRTTINRVVGALHGIGLLLLLFSGFAIVGFSKIGFPNWLIAKAVLWVGMVAVFVLTKRNKIPTVPGVIASIALGGVVVWLCLIKPF